MAVCGATGKVCDANEDIQEIIRKVKSNVQSESGLVFEEFIAVKYRSQLVNGINYFIKVRVGRDQHLHLRVHKSFQGEVTLSGFLLNKSLEDELEHFQ